MPDFYISNSPAVLYTYEYVNLKGRAGRVCTLEAIRASEAFENETDGDVWYEVLSGVGEVGLLVQERVGPDSDMEVFNTWRRRLLRNVFARLGWSAGELGESTFSHISKLFYYF